MKYMWERTYKSSSWVDNLKTSSEWPSLKKSIDITFIDIVPAISEISAVKQTNSSAS